jgi:hypothetical protein
MVLRENLLAWNRKGLIPGPKQKDEQFIAKVLKLSQGDRYELAQFDLSPDWLILVYSSKGLSPWEGAMTWVNPHPDGFGIPTVQLRDDLKFSVLRKWYPLEELIAHEIVHAVRADFEEDVFEEILAYQTSSKRWRRWLGPLLRHPREAYIFLGLLLIALLIQWVDMSISLPSWCSLFLWLPWLSLGLGLVRLTHHQSIFQRCLENIGEAVGDRRLSLPIALRLTDREIRLFAQSSSTQIREYAAQNESLRWKMIRAAYFDKSNSYPGAATG